MTKIALEELPAEALPYACHYDEETIITKNGEMMFTVRIEEFYSYSSIRNKLQKLAPQCEKLHVGLWVQTVRSKVKEEDFVVKHFKHSICEKIYQDYTFSNKANRKFTNSLYITYITKCPPIFCDYLGRVKNLFIGLQSEHSLEKFFKKERENLEFIKQSSLEIMAEFNVNILKVEDNVSHCLSYFDFLLSFEHKNITLDIYDVSRFVSSNYKIAFGSNVLHIKDKTTNQNKYASILGLKEVRVPQDISDINSIFEKEQEFIITETIFFEENVKKAHIIYNDQLSLLNTSGDDNLKNNIGLVNFEQDTEKLGFCNQGINILLFDDNLNQLDQKIHQLSSTLSECGFIFIRHDIFLENIYYSILPGNFAYLQKLRMSTINNLGVFTDIGDYFSGLIAGGIWKSVICGFRTINNRMNFFNFHGISKEVGHTVIAGYNDKSKFLLRNLLISQALDRVNNLKVVLIECTPRSYVFSYAMSGSYINFTDKKKIKYGLNPFNKVKDGNGVRLLKEMLSYIDYGTEETKLTAQEIDKVIDDLKTLTDNNNILDIKNILLKEPKLDKFVNDTLFDYVVAPEKNFLSKNCEGFNVGILIHNPNYYRFFVHYILQTTLSLSNGDPMIISIGATNLLDHFSVKYLRNSLMLRAKKLNCTIIFTISNIDRDDLKEHNNTMIHDLLDTVIVFTSDITQDIAYDVSISPKEMKMIDTLNAYDKSFFLKQRDRSTVLKFDMFDSIYSDLLFADEESIKKMWQAVEYAKLNKKSWVQKFLSLSNEKK